MIGIADSQSLSVDFDKQNSFNCDGGIRVDNIVRGLQVLH
jgi:hypothetical protein